MPVIRGSGGNPSRYGNFVGDVFGLRDVYEKQVENVEQNNKFASWPEQGNIAYYGGTGSSLFYRYNLTTESLTVPSPKLSVSRIGLRAVESESRGYFAGGSSSPPFLSTVERVEISTEVASIIPSAFLSQIKWQMGSCSSNFYGYFAGGGNPGGVSTIDRIEFSTELRTTPTPKISRIASFMVRGAQSNFYGYMGGGGIPTTPSLSTIERLDFTTEVVAIPVIPAKLLEARSAAPAVSSIFYGYFTGGSPNAFPQVYNSRIDRIDFSTETVTTPTPKLSQNLGSQANSSNFAYGYLLGGNVPVGAVSVVNRLDFTTETISNPPVLPTQIVALDSFSYRG
jgi:hypothetical protein